MIVFPHHHVLKAQQSSGNVTDCVLGGLCTQQRVVLATAPEGMGSCSICAQGTDLGNVEEAVVDVDAAMEQHILGDFDDPATIAVDPASVLPTVHTIKLLHARLPGACGWKSAHPSAPFVFAAVARSHVYVVYALLESLKKVIDMLSRAQVWLPPRALLVMLVFVMFPCA